MSPTARLALAVVCWALALVAEITAVLVLFREGRRTGRALRRWRDEDPEHDALLARQRRLDAIVDVLLGNELDRSAAVVLLLVGIVVGAIGNFLSL
jgi:hypothetical protein